MVQARSKGVEEGLHSRDRELFGRAFKLAYFLHVNKEIAFFIAEDALEELSVVLGYQGKNRTPSERLRGFWKWGEHTRPIRKTLMLSELQMLQWLVYKQSQTWERATEQQEGLYISTEEDMIVRYLEYLVFITGKQNSFYVTLAVGSLLCQFSRREVRLFYDILTQSDSARMKDTNYIGKQRLQLLDRVSQRFQHFVETINKPGDEKQFKMMTTTDRIVGLVTQTLRRLTPWDTTCSVKPGFDVTDIPALYFSETNLDDEDLIELKRIHTVLDPECFTEFNKGLSKYVRSLPTGDLDKTCNFTSPAERLVLPEFKHLISGPPRGNRFQAPELSSEDYIRLQRTLNARAHRKKNFVPDQLVVYLDGVCAYSFTPRDQKAGRVVNSQTSVIEVRGRDSKGEVALASVIVDDVDSSGGGFVGSITHSGGQRVTVKVKRVDNIDNGFAPLQVEINYESRAIKALPSSQHLLSHMKERTAALARLLSTVVRPQSVSLAIAALMTIGGLLIWWQYQLKTPVLEIPPSQPTTLERRSESPKEKSSALHDKPLDRKQATQEIASVRWRFDRAAALNALSVEATRSETQAFSFSSQRTKVTLSFPVYNNEGTPYSRYRLSLSAAKVLIWQKTIPTPRSDLDREAHNLDFILFPQRPPKNDDYILRIEGRAQNAWHSIGSVTFENSLHR